MYTIKRDEFGNHPLLARLLELHSPPEEIHIIGELPEITIDEYGRATPRILTVVGSRNHTSYATDAMRMLMESLSGQLVVIVSGLALGVDSLAHKHAIKHKLKTIAVPGSGLSDKVLYPRTNVSLAKAIREKGGLLISELGFEEKAASWTFPSRNRIMAALSDAVLIIEAEEKSGTLITARQALELGRDIGVVPGNIFSKNSSGTNMLAREGAYVIRNGQDLLDLLHFSSEKNKQQETELIVSKEEESILSALGEPSQKDALLQKSGLSLESFLAAFSMLEMKGYIQETFGEVRKVV